MNPWYIANPALFQKFKSILEQEHQGLSIYIENKTVYVRGSLYIYNEEMREIDRYLIEIKIPHDYPKSIPLVREIEGRLPKIKDRHFNESNDEFNKTACLFLPEERYKYYPKGSSIIDFINGPVNSFFLSQTNFDLTGQWLYGQRGHGLNGIIEFYCEELGTKNIQVIIKFIEYLSKKELKGHWDCYCGSNKKIRQCHFHKLIDFRSKIDQEVAKKSLNGLLNYYKLMQETN